MTKTKETSGESDSLVYQCRLNVSTHTLTHVGDLLWARLRQLRSRWRSLPPGRITVIMLALLRHDQRVLDLAGGTGVSPRTTGPSSRFR